MNAELMFSPGAEERALLEPDVFGWSNSAIVLLMERDGQTWVVVRGWRSSDRLRHIRRWTFHNAASAAGQIRRLVRDAGGDYGVAGDAASRWLSASTNDGNLTRREQE